jgi:serine/threonine protein kinase
VLSLFSHQGVQEFLNEVDLLSRINHRNLVSLLGYCNETREVMLIYEHMPGGSLRDHLYGPSAEHSELNWKRRLKIALDAAQGLEYLHVGSNPKIIHRDIKTANILLDSNMNGKLADFGLSRMTIDEEATHVTTAVKGTAGYLDPEYFITQMLTEKSDVYSFGVVLLEIICGRPPIDVKLPVDDVNIIRWVTPYIMEKDDNAGKITEIIDKRLAGSYNMKSITSVIMVAMRCVQSEPSSRPSVSEVVAVLKEAMNHENIASISISEEIDIASGDLLAAPVCSSLDWSEPKVMEWSDNSANISKVGR